MRRLQSPSQLWLFNYVTVIPALHQTGQTLAKYAKHSASNNTDTRASVLIYSPSHRASSAL